MRTIKLLCVLLSLSSCEKDEPCRNCSDEQVISEFAAWSLRTIVTSQGPQSNSITFLRHDSVRNVTTEFTGCLTEGIATLEHKKVIRASGKILRGCEPTENNHLILENYRVVDYCDPQFVEKEGEFTLQRKWMVYSISSPDTVIRVPCESYPTGANVEFTKNSLSGSTGVNGFHGEIVSASANEIRLSNPVIGLFVGTDAENTFQESFLNVVSPLTPLTYTIDHNILIIHNPNNNYTIKLFAS